MNLAALGGCLMVILWLGAYATPAESADNTVRVGIYQNKPKVFIDEVDKPRGFWVDLLEHIADAEDWSLEYLECQWDRCLEAIEQGQLNLMVDVAYSEERSRRFDFNREVVFASWSVVYTRPGVTLKSILDLDQKRVAVLKESIQHAALVERTQAFDITPQFIEVADFHEMFRLLAQGDVEAGVVNRFFGQQAESQYKVVKTNILVYPAQVHFAAPKGKQTDLLATLDRHLKDLTADSNSAYYQAFERWLKPEKGFGWPEIRHFLRDMVLYAPLIGLVAFVLWNRSLRREIARRQQAETHLQESQQRYAALAEAAPVGIFGSDVRGNCTYVNDRWCQITGRSPEDAKGEGWEQVLHPEERNRVAAAWAQSLRENRPCQLEYRIQRPDGTVRWVYGQSAIERDANGKMLGYVGTITDISERKQTEILLQESEQRLQRTFELAPFPIMIHAEDGEVLQINAAWVELTGYTHQDIPTTQAWAQQAYGDRAASILEKVITKKYALESRWEEGEFTITTRDGSQRIWQFSSAPLGLMPDGRRAAISMAVDITERKQAEALLQESEERYHSIYEQAAVGLANATLDGNFLNVNPRFCEMLGYSRKELLTKTAWEITHPDDRPKMLPAVQRLFAGEVPYFFQEKRYLRKDGSCFWSSTGLSLVRDASGKPKHALVVIRDITQRKEAERRLIASENKFHNIFDYAAVGIVYASLKGELLDCNPRFCQMLGYTAAELTKLTVAKITHPDDRDIPNLSRLIAGEIDHVSKEKRYLRKDSTVMWAYTTASLLRDEMGNPFKLVAAIEDISERKQTEIALRESEERLRLVTENMSDLVCLHHPDGRYLYVTPSSQTLLGYSPEELIGRHPRELFHPDDRERICQEAYEPTLNNIPSRITSRIRRKTGEYIWLETLTKAILSEEGQVKHLQTTSREVSDRVQAEEQLKHDALHDALTGLPNRSLLMERLDLSLKRAKRHPEFQFAVLFLDLDNFKVINDSLGHPIGDELLVVVAEQLTKLIRETDVAARLGGDEFVILLEELDEFEEAVWVAERVLSLLRSPLQIAEREVFTGTSFGIVAGTTKYHRAEDILRDADLAMYRAKHSGRGRYAIFDPAMHLQVMQRLHLESDLRQALENGEFVLYYQPIVYLENQVIQGFEALIRWRHPQRGTVSPEEFIPIAEETGLIVPIGEWILQAACQQLATWQTQFPEQSLSISVNLSVKQLQKFLLKHLDEVLINSGIQKDSLVLEITESMLVEKIQSTRALLDQIKAKGIRLKIDDFGTGYSSLSYLHLLPVDALKIDRAFVSLAKPDARNQVIAESIIALSNLLKLEAIAEGVETPQQLQWLKELGCELGQGFLFSPPVPAAQATELLKDFFEMSAI